jgi:hypothetical protein
MKNHKQQIFYTLICFFYLAASIYQIYNKLPIQFGDSSGTTAFNPIYIYSVVALVVATTAMGYWNILSYWISSKNQRILLLLVTITFNALLVFVSPIALLGLSAGLSVLALTKKNLIDFIYASTLPTLLLTFGIADSLFRLFRIVSLDAWLPGIVLSNAVNLILVLTIWYYTIFKLKNARDDSQARNSD